MRFNKFFILSVVLVASSLSFVFAVNDDVNQQELITLEDLEETKDHQADVIDQSSSLERPKRTLLLKKKLLGLGALGLGVGFGVGAIKGYALGGFGGSYGGRGGGYHGGGGYGGGYGGSGYNNYYNSAPIYQNRPAASSVQYVDRPVYYEKPVYVPKPVYVAKPVYVEKTVYVHETPSYNGNYGAPSAAISNNGWGSANANANANANSNGNGLYTGYGNGYRSNSYANGQSNSWNAGGNFGGVSSSQASAQASSGWSTGNAGNGGILHPQIRLLGLSQLCTKLHT
ncbi:heterogeneous nuclear ribonucleoprotein A1-like isoform X2 [Athalia rosae]|uniref:heterogeneous nuclear ribonucleoprotein A1-like isoform X2 n=1 Tax=Athalia rosae TaxID=37344 RepID=UPI002033E25A|nr:heterogeneous nuclear ribonucleoprotein A1-like isoform X2 [Athalia rosae]